MIKTTLSTITARAARVATGSGHIAYHIAVVALSAAFAFSLPFTAAFVAKKFLALWSLVGDEKIFVVSSEIGSAILLILLVNHARRSWRERRISRMAATAGLVLAGPATGLIARRKVRRMKEQQGFAREVKIISSTGFRTFVDPKGPLNQVLHNCREAKIMLLHPDSAGAEARAKSVLDADVALPRFNEQIRASIDFLKELRLKQHDIRLKLYRDTPFLRLIILGDYLWIQNYHRGIDSREMVRYVFRYNQDPNGLFVPFYQYFLARWDDGNIPEYDLDTDELVCRDPAGNETSRQKFHTTSPEEPSSCVPCTAA
jgi:hypothetical protein